MVAQAKADQAWRDEMFSWVKELKQIQDIVHRSSHENSQATCRNEVCLMIARRLKSRAFRAIERAAASGKKPGPAGKKTKTPKAKASKPTKVSKPRRGRAKRDPAPTEQLTPEEEAPAPAPEVVTFDNLSTDAA